MCNGDPDARTKMYVYRFNTSNLSAQSFKWVNYDLYCGASKVATNGHWASSYYCGVKLCQNGAVVMDLSTDFIRDMPYNGGFWIYGLSDDFYSPINFTSAIGTTEHMNFTVIWKLMPTYLYQNHFSSQGYYVNAMDLERACYATLINSSISTSLATGNFLSNVDYRSGLTAYTPIQYIGMD